MLKLQVTLFALLCLSISFASSSNAGPNAGAALFVHSNGDVYTTDRDWEAASSIYCELNFGDCEDQVRCAAEIGKLNATSRLTDGEVEVFWVFAGFPENSCPRMSGLTFGVEYDDRAVGIVDRGTTADFELSTGDWPLPFQGTALAWHNALTSQVSEVYWFAAYSYYGASQSFALRPHPTQGAGIADDSVPAVVDDVVGFGVLGFGGREGSNPCLSEEIGACCFADGSCEVLPISHCLGGGGHTQGAGSPCSPSPCESPRGACCLDDDCAHLTESLCWDERGDYLGDYTTCDPDPCNTGACCFSTGLCLQLTEDLCVLDCRSVSWDEGGRCLPDACPTFSTMGERDHTASTAGLIGESNLQLRLAPNPTDGSVEIRYAIEKSATVSVSVFGLDGRRVAELSSGLMPAGSHVGRFNLRESDLSAGRYFVAVSVDGALMASTPMTVR